MCGVFFGIFFFKKSMKVWVWGKEGLQETKGWRKKNKMRGGSGSGPAFPLPADGNKLVCNTETHQAAHEVVVVKDVNKGLWQQREQGWRDCLKGTLERKERGPWVRVPCWTVAADRRCKPAKPCRLTEDSMDEQQGNGKHGGCVVFYNVSTSSVGKKSP